MATPDALVGNSLSRSLAAGHCALCLLPLDLPYGAVVELVRNSISIRTVCIYGLHQHCAREWSQSEIKVLLARYGNQSQLSFVCRIAIEQ